MTVVVHLLIVIEQGAPSAAEQLLRTVHEELTLAAKKMAQEAQRQTSQAKIMVHERPAAISR